MKTVQQQEMTFIEEFKNPSNLVILFALLTMVFGYASWRFAFGGLLGFEIYFENFNRDFWTGAFIANFAFSLIAFAFSVAANIKSEK